MDDTRRQFLQYTSLMGVAPVLANAIPNLQSPRDSAQDESFHANVLDFWTNQVRSPYQDFVDGVKGKGAKPPQPKDSTFVFPSANKGLVPAGTLTPDDIKDFPANGDIDIEVHVERFRPSPEDSETLASLESGTLRIDVKQVTPLVGLPEALAWTAMATLASKKKGQTMPTLSNVKFDPGTAWGNFQKIPLTGGLGFWSWNFFMKARRGFWGQLLDELFKTLDTVQPILPLLGIPGIAVSGLKYVDQIVGAVQAQGDSAWMFKGLDIAVCATQQSYKDAGAQGASKLLLTNGSYVILPESAVSRLDSTLVIQDGLLVPPKTPPLQIYAAAAKILPDVSYMTISVSTSASKTIKATTASTDSTKQDPVKPK